MVETTNEISSPGPFKKVINVTLQVFCPISSHLDCDLITTVVNTLMCEYDQFTLPKWNKKSRQWWQKCCYILCQLWQVIPSHLQYSMLEWKIEIKVSEWVHEQSTCPKPGSGNQFAAISFVISDRQKPATFIIACLNGSQIKGRGSPWASPLFQNDFIHSSSGNKITTILSLFNNTNSHSIAT